MINLLIIEIGLCNLVWDATINILGLLRNVMDLTHRMLNRSPILSKWKLHEMKEFLKKWSVELCDGWMTFLLSVNTKAAEKTHCILLVYVTIHSTNLAPQVGAKRTNRPGISTTDRGFPRARFRSRGGSFSSRARYYSGYTPPRGRGRAFRWADAKTPHLWQCGMGEHCTRMHIILLTVSTEREGRTEQTRKSHHDQPEATAGVKHLHRPTIMIFIAALLY